MYGRRAANPYFWIGALTVASPVIYTLSACPFIWLYAHGFTSDVQHELIMSFYWPVNWTYINGPEWWRAVLDACARLCGQ